MSESNMESYPPLFRVTDSNRTRKPELKSEEVVVEDGGGTLEPSVLPLPLVNMQCLDAEKLDRACREWGIFRLENHGVPSNVLKELQEHAKRVFEFPFKAKQGLNNRCPIKFFWGTPATSSSGVAVPRANNMDWIEGFHLPFSQLHQHQHVHLDPLINDFRKLLEEYSRHLTRIGSTVFEAIIKNLELDLNELKSCLDESSGLIRVYRYPKHNINEHVKGLHEHTDSSTLSILSEDQVGGLQFYKDDQWFKVKPIPNTLVVNLGDMMQVVPFLQTNQLKEVIDIAR
ncbi:gibberellin 2-beta-dioxygenase 6 isoform X2 [Amaranthus tricolor]|uniref:gibberellin 2-beta-dioxygenase 6 isoform X2 n=1 Tax=Amaranthus tricolor TaxID=29722 RepID=UPI002586681B|nr:gibberellin 2-beta-dioxygenase 6 isoform X2 [Amaranthus tricolor]